MHTLIHLRKGKTLLVQIKIQEWKVLPFKRFGIINKIFLNMNKVCYDRKWYSDVLFWNDDEHCD